jgi:ABC-2 type transport system permease protein
VFASFHRSGIEDEMKIFKLAWTYLRIGVANEVQYRINFFIQVLQSFIALGTGLIGLALVFNYTSALNGWSRPELLAVMGVYTLMGGLIQTAIQPNMERLTDEIQRGTLDFALTKPADGQVLVSVREFRFWHLVDGVVGLIVVVVAVTEIQVAACAGCRSLDTLQVLAFILVLILGGIMIYCFWLILSSIAFWVIRVNDIVNLFEGMYAAGRWPVGIYPDWLRLGLTFLIPVAFAVTVPAEALTGRLTTINLLGAFGLTIFLMVLARIIWRLGIRHYSGASA